jgi:SNF2 family DNA or RNA helicase
VKVLHTLWLPDPGDAFIQAGEFYLWVETLGKPHGEKPRGKQARQPSCHPHHLQHQELAAFLGDELKFNPGLRPGHEDFRSQGVVLPSVDRAPLPSPELTSYLDETPPEEDAALAPWQVDGFRLDDPIRQINDIHFLAFCQASDVLAGGDFLFWYYFTQSLKQVILKDHYIPALVCRQAAGKGKASRYELYSGWEIVSAGYDALLEQAVEFMPLACTLTAEGTGYDRKTLLRHCAEVVISRLIRQTRLPAVFEKKFAGTLMDPSQEFGEPWQVTTDLALYQAWRGWRRQLAGGHEDTAFHLAFRLREALADAPDHWQLEFVAVAKRDLSLQVSLADYWPLQGKAKAALHKDFGQDFEKRLLLGLGLAARIYPKIWAGLETAEPAGVALTLEEAFAFLKESAWVLEDAGFKVIVPAWWTPAGRRRAKVRLRAAPGKKPAATAKGSSLSLENLIQYRYELAIGGEPITPAEWERLVKAKTPLVYFRGQWMELDQRQMQAMLAFWQQHGDEAASMSLQDLLRKTVEEAETFEVDPADALSGMLEKLRDRNRLEAIDDPPQLRATLRDYQRRGVAWLGFLEQSGLNGCLADDMGLGKTLQVITRLVMEKPAVESIEPTLIVCPTSVLGNWGKEIERFAPHLKTLIHHGSQRAQSGSDFQTGCKGRDVLITSYALVRKDLKLFEGMRWRRVVLDEAQNIKNPVAAQTKAILKLTADHRLALTGTPVENRLLDLWSIFNFLNPGYLGKQAQFRKTYELPIQRDNDALKSTTLKRLIEPFLLRRVKTDPNIIKDLPDKVENKQYCNLSQEQASLYEAVVREVEKQLDGAEGIGRQGLMLSTLMKLKQICNHPRQFLQDGSAFTPERSHKLERLAGMLEEVAAEGESALVFTQFTEIGQQLEDYLRHGLHLNTYYLHGGTARGRREKMIAQFQDPESDPAVFILSLKAGGVGITLTRANHVFHFDRWWNPAVEDQATDRAFRIGQTRNVFVHKFITLGTLEERIDQMIEDKKQIAGAIVGADESWLAQLDNERFKQLIRLNRETVLE